ncbi:UDP-glucuronosyltransferase 1-7-like [Rhopalosiphum maidis]|uniref:UDP-glucuronosyltransferase 1-7-like n=1 Tax=Rhopalosiphum maidis TaxID=43146 RepID=UPI000EFE96A0|nr:UDP-glucuronosyltransferase 1-7-like [Rhopalosiphum maidis]XP_026819772.1 UDP-glucuronosyltransferase 1-7-like [Rhopalosiphum maidis]
MKYITILAILLNFYVNAIKSSNILVFVPSPWKSHIVSFQPLFLELANRGHNVTVVSKFIVKDPPPTYTQLIPSYVFDIDGRSDFLMRERSIDYSFIEDPITRSTILVDTTFMFISDPEVQKFIKYDQSNFDLVIIESFFQECTVALGHKYRAPIISIVPVPPWTSVSQWAKNPSDFSYIKDFMLDGGKSLTFWERFTNSYIGFYSLFVELITYLPKLENMMDTYFQYPGYENRPTMAEMLKNISLSLIDSDVTIFSPRPYVPNFIEVPGIHVQPFKKMHKRLQEFMEKANTGVVYFNFGTILNVTSIPKQSLRSLINVLGRLEQKIVFKWINNDTQQFPNNFYVNSWLPQREILNHPNCKVFITHGGVHSIIETVDAGVPIIGFPVFGDQFQNVKISQENGIGIMSNIFTITEEIFEKDIKHIINDKKFSENVKRMSSIFRDRPMSALDTAVYWVEYVIRHKGAHHLRSAAVDLTWYQYYLLDVIVFLIIIVLFFICILYFITKRIMRLLFNLFKQKTD